MSLFFLVYLLNFTASVRDATPATARNPSFVSEYPVQIDQQTKSPTIDSDLKQYTLARGASVTVQCVSSSPISWYREEHFPTTSMELVTCGNADQTPSSGSHCASMVFNNASIEQMGRYYCVKDADLRRYRLQYGWKGNAKARHYLAELETEFHATSMYLFVDDPEWPETELTARYNIIQSGAPVHLVCGMSNCRRGINLKKLKLALIPSAGVKENEMQQRDLLQSTIENCGSEVVKELIIDSAKEEHSGSYRCEADWTNPDGSLHITTVSTVELYVLDSSEGIVFFLDELTTASAIRIPQVQRTDAQEAIEVRPVTIAIKHPFGTNVSCSWYRDGMAIEAVRGNGCEQYEIRHQWTRDSLTILNPSIWDSGRYTVECIEENGTKRHTSRDVFIEGDWKVKASPNRQVAFVPSNPIELVCRSRGVEDPEFQLYSIKCEDQQWDECRAKNELENLQTTSNSTHHTDFEDYYVAVVAPQEFGIVVCEVSSKQGKQSAETLLQSSSRAETVAKGTLSRKLIIMAVLLAFLLVLLFVCIVWGYRKFTDDKARLSGNHLIWDTDRIGFLPDVYRFPREKLQLCEVLGRGEFGVIWKAKVSGVVDDPSLETVVAVKEARELNDEQMMAMLLYELKAHVHVGHHLNVVNLLGAVVDNFTQGELMLIMEYCQFGDLKEFFQQNRASFENKDDDGLFGVAGATVGTDGSPFSKTDLLFWACQVAGGMDYLSTSGLIHGDLAARNVLLCDGGIVKICDFGMARIVHRDDVDRKPNGKWFPIAWMALESIREGIFSINSDVWAYGVLLWELFTLGAEPYSEMLMIEPIVDLLEQGYRMQKPEYASMEVYLLMRNCWESEPGARPTFKQLHVDLHNMLPDRLFQYYARLNELYVFKNAVGKETERKKPPLHVYVNASTVGSMRVPEVPSQDVPASVPEQQMQTPTLPQQIQEQEIPEVPTQDVPTSVPEQQMQTPTLPQQIQEQGTPESAPIEVPVSAIPEQEMQTPVLPPQKQEQETLENAPHDVPASAVQEQQMQTPALPQQIQEKGTPEIGSSDVPASVTEQQMQIPTLPQQIQEKGSTDLEP